MGSEPKCADDSIDDRLGQPRDVRQQAEAAGRDRDVEIERGIGDVQHRWRPCQIEQAFAVQRVERGERLFEMPRRLFVEVVLDKEAAIVFDAGHQLEQLQLHEATLDAELDDVDFDLGLAMRRTISVRCSTATMSRNVTRSSTSSADKRRAHFVEAVAIALERLQRLVGPEHDVGGRLQAPLWSSPT